LAVEETSAIYISLRGIRERGLPRRRALRMESVDCVDLKRTRIQPGKGKKIKTRT